jgi:hypothetical protein
VARIPTLALTSNTVANGSSTASLVCDALMMAIWLRRPKAGLTHHSDRGSQYASKKWTMPIRNWNLALSQLAIFFEGRLDDALEL